MRLLWSCICVWWLMAAPAFAGAWVRDPGEWQAIHTFTYYETDRFTAIDGNGQDIPRYTKWEVQPSVEYGLTDHTTVGGTLFIQRVRQDNPPGVSRTNTGIGDTELFVRHRLLQFRNAVVSVQPLIKLPRLTSDQDFPPVGSPYADVELRLLAGYAFPWLGQHHYLNAEAAYRTRGASPADQVHVDLSAGMALSDSLTLMPQLFTTFSTDLPGRREILIARAQDYDLVKPQLSLVYAINAMISLQAGAFHHSYARNTGRGGGVFIGLWQRF